MRDLFITPQPELLSSWLQAFPKAKRITGLNEITSTQQETICWVHIDIAGQKPLADILPAILKHAPSTKIIVLANAPSQSEAFYALGLGAQGYCHAFSPSKVLKEIKTVVTHGGIWVGSDFLKQLIHATTNLAGNKTHQVSILLAKLTKREQQVAIEAAKGLSNKEIARILNITDRTVKAHLSSAFETLGAKDRLHLALMLNDNSLK